MNRVKKKNCVFPSFLLVRGKKREVSTTHKSKLVCVCVCACTCHSTKGKREHCYESAYVLLKAMQNNIGSKKKKVNKKKKKKKFITAPFCSLHKNSSLSLPSLRKKKNSIAGKRQKSSHCWNNNKKKRESPLPTDMRA